MLVAAAHGQFNPAASPPASTLIDMTRLAGTADG